MFENAAKAKKETLVSVNHFSGLPEAKLSGKLTTERVIEFLKNYIARHGISRAKITDPVNIFGSKRNKKFCLKRLLKLIECSVRDHRGNGKIERLMRTINERLPTNEQIVMRRDNSGLLEILFALRMYQQEMGLHPIRGILAKSKHNEKAGNK